MEPVAGHIPPMTNDSVRRYLMEAVRLAERNVSAGGGPFAALVVRDGEVVATGVNRVTADDDPTAHAEVTAIREACRVLGTFQLDGCEIYASSEPCPMCLGAIHWARPQRVFYANPHAVADAAGFDDGGIYEELCSPPEARALPTRQVEVPDAERPFRAWAETEDKIEY